MSRWVWSFTLSCVGLLVFVYLALWAFNGFHGLGLDLTGIIALTAGTIVTAGLGVGLMALVFYSDRSGQDDRVRDAGRSPPNTPDGRGS
ncbi:MAG: hypothetical protein JWL84_607 [Rhodospirillales bacterium]|nr:hypothetical protein [Rhodospirillales bacterium]